MRDIIQVYVRISSDIERGFLTYRLTSESREAQKEEYYYDAMNWLEGRCIDPED